MLLFEPDRDLHENGVVVELVSKLVANAHGICTLTITLVDERDAWNAVALHLPVDRDRLTLYTCNRAEHQDCTVEDAERTLHLDGEVDVPGGVDDVDVDVFPRAVSGSRLNRNAPLPFQLHRVHLGPDAVFSADVVDCMDTTGVEQDPLGQGGLP